MRLSFSGWISLILYLKTIISLRYLLRILRASSDRRTSLPWSVSVPRLMSALMLSFPVFLLWMRLSVSYCIQKSICCRRNQLKPWKMLKKSLYHSLSAFWLFLWRDREKDWWKTCYMPRYVFSTSSIGSWSRNRTVWCFHSLISDMDECNCDQGCGWKISIFLFNISTLSPIRDLLIWRNILDPSLPSSEEIR